MDTLFKTACLLLCVFVCPASADSPKSVLRGVVTDPEGAVIQRARIMVHWDQSGAHVGLATNVGLPEDLTLETNKDGQFSSEVPPGFYDLFVSATAFSPDCRKVRIHPGERADYNFKLEADPLVTKELGFYIPDAPK